MIFYVWWITFYYVCFLITDIRGVTSSIGFDKQERKRLVHLSQGALSFIGPLKKINSYRELWRSTLFLIFLKYCLAMDYMN